MRYRIIKFLHKYVRMIKSNPRLKRLNYSNPKFELIHIEVHSYCNRTCWYCGNSYINRKFRKYLPEETFLKVLNDLAKINYKGIMAFTGFNEPLADEIIFTRLNQAKRLLPKVTYWMNTNSDYLDMVVLWRLEKLGLNLLNIQLYDGKDKAHIIASKLQIKIKQTINEPDWVEYTSRYRSLKIRLYWQDFTKTGTTRGDIKINNSKRNSPCMQPFYATYIHYNGDVMPCCNMRPEENKSLGNVNKESILNIWMNKKYLKFREKVFTYDVKKDVCKDCQFDLIYDNKINRMLIKKR